MLVELNLNAVKMLSVLIIFRFTIACLLYILIRNNEIQYSKFRNYICDRAEETFYKVRTCIHF